MPDPCSSGIGHVVVGGCYIQRTPWGLVAVRRMVARSSHRVGSVGCWDIREQVQWYLLSIVHALSYISLWSMRCGRYLLRYGFVRVGHWYGIGIMAYQCTTIGNYV